MYINNWEEFEKAAQTLYLQNPTTARYTIKYIHNQSLLKVKMTDDVQCLQFKTDIVQDLRKVEKFVSNLIKHMASKEKN